MNITAVQHSTSLPETVTAVAPGKTAEHRAIAQAARTLNETGMFGEDNHLKFQVDPGSKRMVLQVVNQKTQEVVLQIPPEYVLRMAEDLKEQQARANADGVG